MIQKATMAAKAAAEQSFRYPRCRYKGRLRGVLRITILSAGLRVALRESIQIFEEEEIC